MPPLSPAFIPRHAPDDLMLRIEMLRDMAQDVRLGTLAFWLEAARREAERISEQARRGDAEGKGSP